jgi:hypothetical protein
MQSDVSRPMRLTGRSMLGSSAAMITALAVAQECRHRPPPHHKGPMVFLGHDQIGSQILRWNEDSQQARSRAAKMTRS